METDYFAEEERDILTGYVDLNYALFCSVVGRRE